MGLLGSARPDAANMQGAYTINLGMGWPFGRLDSITFDLKASREIDRLIVLTEEQAERIDYLENALLHATEDLA